MEGVITVTTNQTMDHTALTSTLHPTVTITLHFTTPAALPIEAARTCQIRTSPSHQIPIRIVLEIKVLIMDALLHHLISMHLKCYERQVIMPQRDIKLSHTVLQVRRLKHTGPQLIRRNHMDPQDSSTKKEHGAVLEINVSLELPLIFQ